jgi:LuxR family transcriptional regulator, maltose regulon positive regulatory protein
LQLTGEVETSEARLTLVEQTLDRTFELKDYDVDKTLGLLNYRRAYSSFLSGEHKETISYAKKALDHLPESAILIRVHTVLFLGLAHRNLGQLQEALDIYNSILHITEKLGGTSVAVFHYIHLSDLYWEMAQLQQAKDLCEKAISITEQKTGRPDMPYCGFVYTRIGRILRQWNQLQDSLEFTMKGHSLCLDWKVTELLALSYIEVAYINLALGNKEQALTSIDEAIRINDNFSPWGKKFAEAHKAKMELSRGDIEYAEKIVQTNDSLMDENFQFHREIEYIALSRLLIAQKKFDEARVLINRIFNHAQGVGKKLTELKCLILFSMLFYAEGDVDQALEYLYKAFAIAEQEGFIRIFVDEGPPMARLLFEALSREIAPDYVQKLLAAFPVDDPEQLHPTQTQSREFQWIEPLSDRELEVLRLVAEGLTRQEIATKLVLSLNTIKTHTRNIYSKLGVNNQMQAVGKARALGLLENE